MFYKMQIPFEVYNDSDNEIKAVIQSNQVVQALVSNLTKKKAYISTLNFSDETIPKFIPKFIEGSVSAFRDQIYNYLTNQTLDVVNIADKNNVQDILMTPYYVMCCYSNVNNLKKYYVQYVKHVPTNTINTPNNYPSNKLNYYENSYYYYYNFGLFLNSLEDTLNTLLTQMASDMGITYTGDAFTITYNNSTVTYNVNQSILNASGDNDDVRIFMSNNLKKLLSFQAVENIQNLYSEIKLDNIVSGDFISTQIPLSIVKVCAVKNILLDSNMPCQNVQFYSSNNLPDEVEEHRTVLMLYYNTSTVFGPSQTATYDISMPIPYIYFTSDHFFQNNKLLQFSIWLRLNNGIMIQHILQPEDYINLVMRLELTV